MPSKKNKIPKQCDDAPERPPAPEKEVPGPSSADGELEAILFSLLGERGKEEKMKSLKGEPTVFEDFPDTTAPSEDDVLASQDSYSWGVENLVTAEEMEKAYSLPAATLQWPQAAHSPFPAYDAHSDYDYPQAGYFGWPQYLPPQVPFSSSGALQAQSVLGMNSAEFKRGANWHLAWCADFQRMHQHQKLKDSLHQLVVAKGGEVVPFWSARSLSKWLQSKSAQNVPYVMLADANVLDMSLRSTTLHNGKQKVAKRPVHVFVSTYENEALPEMSHYNHSIPCTLAPFSDAGLREVAGQCMLMVLGIS